MPSMNGGSCATSRQKRHLTRRLPWKWLACAAHLRVLTALNATHAPDALDCFVSGVIISAGTEGFNTVLKFMGYAKEEKKADVQKKAMADAS